MWIVNYKESVYPRTDEKVFRFETSFYFIAFFVYQFLLLRYSVSVHPIKRVTIYKVTSGIPKLRSYKIDKSEG